MPSWYFSLALLHLLACLPQVQRPHGTLGEPTTDGSTWECRRTHAAHAVGHQPAGCTASVQHGSGCGGQLHAPHERDAGDAEHDEPGPPHKCAGELAGAHAQLGAGNGAATERLLTPVRCQHAAHPSCQNTRHACAAPLPTTHCLGSSQDARPTSSGACPTSSQACPTSSQACRASSQACATPTKH